MFDIDSKERYYMNTFGIKPFANYDQALAHYHSVAPIRGKTVRPLGIRRHHNSASISLDEATGVIWFLHSLEHAVHARLVDMLKHTLERFLAELHNQPIH